MHSTTTNSPDANPDRVLGGLLSIRALALLSLVMIVLSLCLYYTAGVVGGYVRNGGFSSYRTPTELTIGNDVLVIPGNLFRFSRQRRAADTRRVDLFFHWPSMSGYVPELRERFIETANAPELVFLTIETRQMNRDMTGRIDPIYATYFEGPAQASPGGLIRRDLARTSVYGGEYLVEEPDSPYPYAARCIEPQSDQSPYCLRDIHMGRGLSVTYRFDASLLAQWRPLEEAVRTLIGGMLR